MGRLNRYIPFFASAVLMWLVLYIIYPHYQYYIDPDGTAYLTISKRYAAGDYARAINGYWSPWSCWLTAALIRAGLQPIPASVVINALAATGFLWISQSFFLKFSIQRRLQWLFCGTLVVFLCYAVFWQSFDDLWECFFLLVALRLMLIHRFLEKPSLWILAGLVGALAYFAKAYSFPFFILNIIACSFLLSRQGKGKWVLPSLVAIFTMVLCSIPWIVALHNKYGIWTTSTSGSLNMSWYLVGHPEWKAGIKQLLPPVYPDSPYYWEDPYVANGATPHFWNSWHLFGLQILRVGYNLFKLLRSMVQLSLFFPLLCLLAALLLRGRQFAARFSADTHVIAFSTLLFPLGYLLINYEARYLWYMVPLSMVLGGLITQRRDIRLGLPQRVTMYALPLSFIIYPLVGLITMWNAGKSEYDLATRLKTAGLHGTFTSNAHPRITSKVAYFSGIPYYAPSEKLDNTQPGPVMKTHNSDYYIQYPTTAETPTPYFNGNIGSDTTLQLLSIPAIEPIKVYRRIAGK